MFLAHLLPPHPASFDYFRQALLSNSNPVTQTGPQQQGRFLPPLPLLCLIPALVQFPLLILANWEGNAANVCKTISSSSPEPPARVVFTWDWAVNVASPVQTLLGLIHPPISDFKCFSLWITPRCAWQTRQSPKGRAKLGG